MFGTRVRSDIPYMVEYRFDFERPETLDYPSTTVVRLTEGRSWYGYYFEASHEAIHCLEARGIFRHNATYLEEAVAVAFSLFVVEERFGAAIRDECDIGETYQDAVDRTSLVDPDLIALGQLLRKANGSLAEVSLETVRTLYPSVPPEFARAALEPFPRVTS